MTTDTIVREITDDNGTIAGQIGFVIGDIFSQAPYEDMVITIRVSYAENGNRHEAIITAENP